MDQFRGLRPRGPKPLTPQGRGTLSELTARGSVSGKFRREPWTLFKRCCWGGQGERKERCNGDMFSRACRRDGREPETLYRIMNYYSFMRGRPRRQRRFGCAHHGHFKPQGVPLALLETVTLTAAEAEALRLADLEGKGQEEGASQMRISQPTFHRELRSARSKVADALLNKKAIRIGGETMPGMDGTGPEGKGPMTGRKMGRCRKTDASETDGTQLPPRRGLGRGTGRGRRIGQR